MRNLIKEYIESGKTFENLKEEYGISANYFEDLVCLTYSQIDSPKAEPIVRQCRGIIIDKNTLDIVHYPFYRFFNFEEMVEENINWNNVVALEKVDGSLFGVFYHNNKWYISTRSQIGGLNTLNNCPLTFGDLFDKAINMSRDKFFSLLDKNIDYTFELVSEYNIIVTPYKGNALYLIGARNKTKDFEELYIHQIYSDTLKEIGIKTPKTFSLIDEKGNFRGFDEMKALANSMPNATDEGFVIVDYYNYNSEYGYYPRVKVKNSSYVALHHLRGTIENGTMNYANIFKIVWENEQDEVLATFPQYKEFFDKVEKQVEKFNIDFNNEYQKLQKYFDISNNDRSNKDIKKEFAMNNTSKFKNIFFYMFNKNITFREFIDTMNKVKSNYFKQFYEAFIYEY